MQMTISCGPTGDDHCSQCLQIRRTGTLALQLGTCFEQESHFDKKILPSGVAEVLSAEILKLGPKLHEILQLGPNSDPSEVETSTSCLSRV